MNLKSRKVYTRFTGSVLFMVYTAVRGYTHTYVEVNMATHAGRDPSLKEVTE